MSHSLVTAKVYPQQTTEHEQLVSTRRIQQLGSNSLKKLFQDKS